jgi:hypothetical protein
MTLEQAQTALKNSDIDVYAGKAVSVNFPADITLQIDAEGAGLCIDTAEIAQKAYDYGRGGGFFLNTLKYIYSCISPRSLNIDRMSELNEAYIKDLVAETARKVNAELLENSLKIDEMR